MEIDKYNDIESAEKELLSITNKLQHLKQQNLTHIRDILNTYERLESNALEGSGSQKEAHPKGNFENSSTDSILVCYYQQTGENAATVLKTHLTSVAPCNLVALSNHLDWDESTLEALVAKSTVVIVILSKKCLTQSAVTFVLECLLLYDSVKPILVHDASTCYFPGPSEIPAVAMPLFAEKAVTFLADYYEAVVEQISGRYQEHQHALANLESAKKDHHASTEDVHTRLFLSHRRATAQAIAGKMYEGFKGYSAFLDSETQFKIHNLEFIVSKTDLFIWILSEGYLTSEWCTKELYAALKNNRKIVIVKDLTYKVPEELRSWQDLVTPQQLNDLLENALMLTWMAEYNHLCVETIIERYLGASDLTIAEIPKWASNDSRTSQGLMTKCYGTHGPLVAKTWQKTPIADLLLGLRFNFGCMITNLDLSEVATDELIDALKRWPVTHLNLSNSNVTDAGIGKLGYLVPNLISLDLSYVLHHRLGSLRGLSKLEHLDVQHCANLCLATYESCIFDLCNLKYLNASNTVKDPNAISMIKSYCRKLETFNR